MVPEYVSLVLVLFQVTLSGIMLSIRKGLDCYQAENLLDKPYGYNSTHVIVNVPNDIYCHRYNLKLCSKNAQIRNLDFQKGLLGDIMQGLAIERGLLAYIGFHALVCRDGPPDKGEINKQKLYGLRNETDHGFDRFASDFNNGIIWHLQNEWYKIISKESFENRAVFGRKVSDFGILFNLVFGGHFETAKNIDAVGIFSLQI